MILSLKGEINNSMSKFLLINNHEYRDKIEQEIKVSEIKIDEQDKGL